MIKCKICGKTFIENKKYDLHFHKGKPCWEKAMELINN